MATLSSILAWGIPCTKPGGLQSIGSDMTEQLGTAKVSLAKAGQSRDGLLGGFQEANGLCPPQCHPNTHLRSSSRRCGILPPPQVETGDPDSHPITPHPHSKRGALSPCFALVGSWPSPSYLSSPDQIPGGVLGCCTETASSLRAAWRGRGCRVTPRRASPLPGCSLGVCT